MFDEVANRLLDQIARELSSPDVIFPTAFDLTIRIQTLLKRPDVGLDDIAKVMATEPLISSKVLSYANSVAVRGDGPEVTDLRSGVMRVGFDAVRSVCYAVAVEQMVRSKHMAPFMDISKAMWEHSIVVASIARRMAKTARMNAEKAFFMGVVHDMGAFYLLYRLSADAALASRRDDVLALVFHWHDGIGHALLSAMGLQSEIIEAVQEHEADGLPLSHSILSWTDLLRVSDWLAQGISDWAPPALRQLKPRFVPDSVLDSEAQADLLSQAIEDRKAMTGAMA